MKPTIGELDVSRETLERAAKSAELRAAISAMFTGFILFIRTL